MENARLGIDLSNISDDESEEEEESGVNNVRSTSYSRPSSYSRYTPSSRTTTTGSSRYGERSSYTSDSATRASSYTRYVHWSLMSLKILTSCCYVVHVQRQPQINTIERCVRL